MSSIGAKCTTLITSPSRSVRKRWKRELERIYAVLEAASTIELQRNMLNVKPSVLLLDILLIPSQRRSALRHIQRYSPFTKIIVLSADPRDSEGLDVLKAGAKGYCHAEIDTLFLLKAVEIVQKGEIWAGRSILFRLLNETLRSRKFTPDGKYYFRKELNTLTEREREIAYFIGRGMSNKEIASQINVTEATVKAHLTNIFNKLRLSDRLALALLISRRPDKKHEAPAAVPQETKSTA